MEKILLAQFIAHLVADFFAQPECVSRKKQESVFRSWHLYIHALVVFAASIMMTFTCGFVLWAAATAVLHLGVDAGKCAIERALKKRKNIDVDTLYCNRPLFFADQILHLIVIWIVALLYMRTTGAPPEYYDTDIFTTHNLLLAAGLLLCLKPANALIRVCLSSLPTVGASLEDHNLQKAGRWIGSMERAMAFVLILMGQFTAIGFVIAAKSILRYNKTDRAEYVLVGTLMSFAVAFALGVGITSGFFENVINIISCNI